MNIFGKKIIGIIGIVFFMFGGIVWGLECGKYGHATALDLVCDCDELTKYIDGKGCVPCSEPGVCCGTKLNTNVPFIGDCVELSNKKCKNDSECGNIPGYACIKDKCKVTAVNPNETNITQDEAFPVLMGGLTRILLTVIILTGFIMILAGGVMIASAGDNSGRAGEGKKLIVGVIIGFAVLGASGVILRLINPNFFM